MQPRDHLSRRAGTAALVHVSGAYGHRNTRAARPAAANAPTRAGQRADSRRPTCRLAAANVPTRAANVRRHVLPPSPGRRAGTGTLRYPALGDGCCGSAVAAEVVEEVVDDVQLAGARHLVVDVLADGEVEHAEAERREHHRPVGRQRRPARPSRRRGCRATKSRLPAALLGQVRRRVGLQAVLDVVDDVGRGEQDLRRQVAQRHVQHQRVVREPRQSCTCGAPATVAKTTRSLERISCLRAVVHGDPAAACRPAPGSRGTRRRCRRTGRTRRSRRTTSRCRSRNVWM